MPIIYKLVGIQTAKNPNNEMLHKDWDTEKKSINIKDVKKLFTSIGCQEKMDDIKFITHSETMKEEKDYPLTNDNLVIFVFTMNADLKESLITIFNTFGYPGMKEKQVEHSTPVKLQPDLTLSKPIPEDDIRIDEETINRSNTETVKLFGNKDFKTLLSIYYENPEVFKTFASYVSSGNSIESKNIFSKVIDSEFKEQFDEIVKLNLEIKPEKIQDALKKFNGHLNLTLRYLLTTNSLFSRNN